MPLTSRSKITCRSWTRSPNMGGSEVEYVGAQDRRTDLGDCVFPRIKERTSWMTSLMSRRIISGAVSWKAPGAWRSLRLPASRNRSSARLRCAPHRVAEPHDQATAAGIAIGDYRSERLVHFMGYGRGRVPEGRHTRHMGKRSL